MQEAFGLYPSPSQWARLTGWPATNPNQTVPLGRVAFYTITPGSKLPGYLHLVLRDDGFAAEVFAGSTARLSVPSGSR